MKIIGVDPGTRVTGYGIIEFKGNRYQAVDFGCIRPPSSLRLSARYHIIYDGICALLDDFQPDALAVETQYMQKNVQSALKLGMARGMIILAAEQRGIPIYEYTPTKAKLAVVGSGRASKQQVQAMIQRLLMLSQPPQPEDASDALSLAICHAQQYYSQTRIAQETAQ